MGFLISGFRGLMMTSEDHRVVSMGNALAVFKAAEDIQLLETIKIKETIWFRTHDYIMGLLDKGYLASQVNSEPSQFHEARVNKIQLAICLAYDIGYCWSVTIPEQECFLPKCYPVKDSLMENKIHIDVDRDENEMEIE